MEIRQVDGNYVLTDGGRRVWIEKRQHIKGWFLGSAQAADYWKEDLLDALALAADLVGSAAIPE